MFSCIRSDKSILFSVNINGIINRYCHEVLREIYGDQPILNELRHQRIGDDITDLYAAGL